jgi:hypothetical protein
MEYIKPLDKIKGDEVLNNPEQKRKDEWVK